jgi:PPK2 family polyphosphate:nucleotide phosphotransferase
MARHDGLYRSPRSRHDLLARMRAGSDLDLDDHRPDETFGWEKAQAKAEVAEEVAAVAELQKKLYASDERALLVVLQAMDAGGKDGVIRSVLTGINPAGIGVTSFKVPSETELAHDYLWRVHPACPARGRIGVFNRSHYEDVLVVRVKKLVPQVRWRTRYEHIKAFEQLLVDEGTSIVKLFLNISFDEQRARLQDRIDSPDERWKFRRSDLEERKLWPAYMEASPWPRPRRPTLPGTSSPATASGSATSPWRRSSATLSSRSTRGTPSRRRASRVSLSCNSFPSGVP